MDRQNKIYKNNKALSRWMWIENITLIISILLVIGLYWRWIMPGAITWGDWFYGTKSGGSDFSFTLWNGGAGLGQEQMTAGPLLSLVALQGFLFRIFHWDSSIMQRVVVFGPLVLYLIFSPWYLARTLGFGLLGTATAIIVFNLNAFVFFVATVTTLALGIALAPFVLATFIKLVQQPRLRHAILFALSLSLQIVYEVRIAYVTIFFCILYLFYSIFTEFDVRCNLDSIVKTLFVSMILIFLFHSYWLLPLFFEKTSGVSSSLLPEGYNSVSWVRTLSQGTILNGLGMQSTNWGSGPSPQFLFLPIIAFSPFIFYRQNKKTRLILFFGLSVLISIFLTKGSKPPFGEFYIWMFLHFPGFFMFREPGKWATPLPLSYAVLVGYFVDQWIKRQSVEQFIAWLKRHLNLPSRFIKISLFAVSIAVFFIIFPVNPLSTLHYSGIFDPRPVPEESAYLESFLDSKPDFFRILWLPLFYRFGYSSSQHPGLQAISDLDRGILSPLSKSYPERYSSSLGRSFSLKILRLLSIKYVIVPFAPRDEFCIYYWFGLPSEYYGQLLENTTDFQFVRFKGKSKIYEVSNYIPHLYTGFKNYLFIAGNYNDILPVIVQADYLNIKRPLITISEQNSRMDDSLLNADNFILQDRSLKDLGIEFAESIKIPVSISQNRVTQRVRINKGKTYELWIDRSLYKPIKIRIDKKVVFELEIADNENLNLNKKQDYIKYLKLGELGLETGQHEVELQIDAAYDKSKAPSIIILLVDKIDRLEAQNIIYDKLRSSKVNLSYIFSRSSDFILE
jgi:hypothetical protein